MHYHRTARKNIVLVEPYGATNFWSQEWEDILRAVLKRIGLTGKTYKKTLERLIEKKRLRLVSIPPSVHCPPQKSCNNLARCGTILRFLGLPCLREDWLMPMHRPIRPMTALSIPAALTRDMLPNVGIIRTFSSVSYRGRYVKCLAHAPPCSYFLCCGQAPR